MTHSSPSSTAEVLSEARSEPESGSLKPWHQRIEPFMIPGRYSFFCPSVPHWRIVGPTRVSPKKSARRGALARANSSESRSEEHTSELQSLMRNSYAVFCFKKKIQI